jgi:hypothetical protein
LSFTNGTPTAANLGTPACVIDGETEHLEGMVEPVLDAYRPRGALYGWMEVAEVGNLPVLLYRVHCDAHGYGTGWEQRFAEPGSGGNR